MYRPKMVPSNYTLQAGTKKRIKIVQTKLHLQKKNNEKKKDFNVQVCSYRFVNETIAVA